MKGGKRKVAFALVLAALLAAGVGACGGGDDSTAATAATSASTASAAKPSGKAEPAEPPASRGTTSAAGPSSKKPPAPAPDPAPSAKPASAEPSKEFITPGGDNSVQTYGEEAGASVREAASTALEAFMAARAAGDWEKACGLVLAAAVEPLERILVPSSGCTATFAALSERLAPSAWANTMTGPIAGFRLEGDHAFALYHGSDRTDYFMQMSTEGGSWKVAALEPTPLS